LKLRRRVADIERAHTDCGASDAVRGKSSVVPSLTPMDGGLVGELYLPQAPCRVCVVALSGSGGGLSHRPTAIALARAGVPAVALAYFGLPGLPRHLAEIPLEYFARAVAWVRAQPALRDGGLVVMGASRGAELALQLAATYGDFAACIATSPSSVRWGSVGRDAPAWTLDGKPLPRVLARPEAPAPRATVWDGRTYLIHRDGFVHHLTDNASVDAAAIAVERIRGPLLLFAGEGDDLWPSALFADRIVAHAHAHTHGRGAAGAGTVTAVKYPDVGHIIPLPDEEPVLRVSFPGADAGMSYGGEREAAIRAGRDRFARIIDLLTELGA
jgi:pimeloyl-ACP methyl ester carboxylesterase